MRQAGAAARVLGAALFGLAFVLPVHASISDTDFAFLSATTPPMESSASVFPSLIRSILAVLLFGSLLLGSLYLAYRRRRRDSGSEIIQVLAAAPIAQGVAVQVIDVSGVLFVVALSRTGQTLLGQITDREKVSEIRTRVSQESLALSIPPIPFKAALQKLFRKPGEAKEAEAVRAARPSAREKVLQEVLDRVRRLNPAEKEKP